MAPRAIASGTISFGLVSVPVKLFSGTQSQSLSFNMLHAKDNSRLKQQYICQTCGEVVERDQMVRGYEYAKDQYAVLTPDELKALETKSDKSIEIEEFVPIEKVDPIYFEKAQLLGPDKGGAKAYRLLSEAMLTMGRVAVGRYRTRGREQLVLIRPRGRGLVLHGLHYADEVASFEDIEFGDEVQLRASELQLAQQLQPHHALVRALIRLGHQRRQLRIDQPTSSVDQSARLVHLAGAHRHHRAQQHALERANVDHLRKLAQRLPTPCATQKKRSAGTAPTSFRLRPTQQPSSRRGVRRDA